ncbi:MAG: polysaccharide deacetylase family protein [Clostridia bacterium]|nr:polysaccharide deacetylase family protein [Clostridia bacterium]
MFKRILCIILLPLMLFSGGCHAPAVETELAPLTSDPTASVSSPTENDLLKEYLESVREEESVDHSYGKDASFMQVDEHFVVGIHYPETELAVLDRAIEAWISDTVSFYEAQIPSSDENDGAETEEGSEDPEADKPLPAELSIAYECFSVGDAFVVVSLKGTFSASHLPSPKDVLCTFNYSLSEERLVTPRDLFDDDSLNSFRAKVASYSGAKPKDVDEHFMDLFLITAEGLEILWLPGSYLPEEEGIRSYLFPYSRLQGLVNNSLIPEDGFPPLEKEDGSSNPSELRNPSVIDPTKPMIALTFDDGPSTQTERLLDIMAKYDAVGSFFVVGNFIDGRKSILKRIDAEGHEIGNHSWSHRQLTGLSEKEIRDQIMLCRAKIYEVTGKDCLMVRPPYGATNAQIRSIGAELGVIFVNWSVDTLDWQSKNADAVYEELMANVKDGAIVLCHDLHRSTVDAMEKVIPKLLEEGYQLVTVSQLLSYSDTPYEAGRVYYRK